MGYGVCWGSNHMTWLTLLLGFLRPLAEPLWKALTHAGVFFAGRRDATLSARAATAEAALKVQKDIRDAESAAAPDARALARRLRERADAARAGRLSDGD